MFDSSRYQSGCDPISIWYDVINARLFFKPKFRFFFCVWVKLSILSYLKQTESSKRNLKYDVFVFCFGCCSMHCTLQLFTWKYPHKARHGSILIAAAAITSSCFGWLFFPLENKNPLTWELHSCSFSLNFFFLSFIPCSCGAASSSSFHSRKSRHHSVHLQHFGTQQRSPRPSPLFQSLQTDDAAIITDKSKSLNIYRRNCLIKLWF